MSYFVLFCYCWDVMGLMFCILFFFFKQKPAYEMRISAWSSDVCSSDLRVAGPWRAPRLPSVYPHRLSPTRHRGRRVASARHRRSRRAATMSSYQARIQAAVANGAIPAEPGGVTHVDVEHAKGCRSEKRRVGKGGGRT